MKIIFLLLSLNAMASISQYQAMGQPLDGSFYLEGDRNHYKNPALLIEAEDSVYLESKDEIGIKYQDYFASFQKNKINLVYQINELSGIGGYVSPQNGKGIEAWGINLGMNFQADYSAYLGFYDSEGGELTPKVGVATDAYAGKLFAEYQGQIFSVPNYEFTFGYGKEYKNFWGDLTYNQVNSKGKTLTATLGGKVPLMERLLAIGSGQKELFFSNKMKIKVGLSWYPVSKVELGLAHSLNVFDLAKPKYEDFNLKLSASYFL